MEERGIYLGTMGLDEQYLRLEAEASSSLERPTGADKKQQNTTKDLSL